MAETHPLAIAVADRLEARRREIARLTRERDEQRERADRAERNANAALAALHHALETQAEMLLTFRKRGVVFTDIGDDAGNWQRVAFTVYTNLCSVADRADSTISAIENGEV